MENMIYPFSMAEEILKGIFWFTCLFDEKNECDFSGTELIALTVPHNYDGYSVRALQFNSKKGTSFTHKDTWYQLVQHRRDLRRYSWNYFPRGRVEIKNNKAHIFVNPNIIKYDFYKQRIIEEFHLEDIRVKVFVDNSTHYNCHADNILIC